MQYRIYILFVLFLFSSTALANSKRLQELYEAGKYERCIKLSERYIKKNKGKVNSYFYQALSYYELSKREDQKNIKKPITKAIVAIQRLTKNDATNLFFEEHETQIWIISQAAEQKAKEYYEEGYYSKAQIIYYNLSQIYPNKIDYLFLLGETQAKNGLHYESAKTFDDILKWVKRKIISSKRASIKDAKILAKIMTFHFENKEYERVLNVISTNQRYFTSNKLLKELNTKYTLYIIGNYSKSPKADLAQIYTMLIQFEQNYGVQPAYERLVAEVEEDHWEIKMLNIVNRYRLNGYENGLVTFNPVPRLFWNEKLANSATRHVKDMQRNDFLGHVGTNGSNIRDRIENTGYEWFRAAENIAVGINSVENAMDVWMANPRFRKNIMDPYFKDFGAAWDGNSWVQNFGTEK